MKLTTLIVCFLLVSTALCDLKFVPEHAKGAKKAEGFLRRHEKPQDDVIEEYVAQEYDYDIAPASYQTQYQYAAPEEYGVSTQETYDDNNAYNYKYSYYNQDYDYEYVLPYEYEYEIPDYYNYAYNYPGPANYAFTTKGHVEFNGGSYNYYGIAKANGDYYQHGEYYYDYDPVSGVTRLNYDFSGHLSYNFEYAYTNPYYGYDHYGGYEYRTTYKFGYDYEVHLDAIYYYGEYAGQYSLDQDYYEGAGYKQILSGPYYFEDGTSGYFHKEVGSEIINRHGLHGKMSTSGYNYYGDYYYSNGVENNYFYDIEYDLPYYGGQLKVKEGCKTKASVDYKYDYQNYYYGNNDVVGYEYDVDYICVTDYHWRGYDYYLNEFSVDYEIVTDTHFGYNFDYKHGNLDFSFAVENDYYITYHFHYPGAYDDYGYYTNPTEKYYRAHSGNNYHYDIHAYYDYNGELKYWGTSDFGFKYGFEEENVVDYYIDYYGYNSLLKQGYLDGYSYETHYVNKFNGYYNWGYYSYVIVTTHGNTYKEDFDFDIGYYGTYRTEFGHFDGVVNRKSYNYYGEMPYVYSYEYSYHY